MVQTICWLREKREQAVSGVKQRLSDAAVDRTQPVKEAVDCGRSRGQEVARAVSPRSRGEAAPRLGLDMPVTLSNVPEKATTKSWSIVRPGSAPHPKGAHRGSSPMFSLTKAASCSAGVRHTWASAGNTPSQRDWDRHDRLSAASFIGVSPMRHRLSLYLLLRTAEHRHGPVGCTAWADSCPLPSSCRRCLGPVDRPSLRDRVLREVPP